MAARGGSGGNRAARSAVRVGTAIRVCGLLALVLIVAFVSTVKGMGARRVVAVPGAREGLRAFLPSVAQVFNQERLWELARVQRDGVVAACMGMEGGRIVLEEQAAARGVLAALGARGEEADHLKEFWFGAPVQGVTIVVVPKTARGWRGGGGR